MSFSSIVRFGFWSSVILDSWGSGVARRGWEGEDRPGRQAGGGGKNGGDNGKMGM